MYVSDILYSNSHIVLLGELFSLVFNRRHVLYSTSLPMCYCIHVKDGLPQLGYKKHICSSVKRQEQHALLYLYQRAQ